jgi:hypothetical protein
MAGRVRAGIVIALVVICSALAGAAIDRAVVHERRRPQFGAGGPGRGTREQDVRRRKEILERMTKELALSAPQRAGIDSVMQRTDSLLRAIRLEMQPRLTQVFEASHAEIHARLDSAQRVKFEAMMPRSPRR